MSAKTIDRYCCSSYCTLASKNKGSGEASGKKAVTFMPIAHLRTRAVALDREDQKSTIVGEQGEKQRSRRLPRESPSSYLLSGTYLEALFAIPKTVCVANLSRLIFFCSVTGSMMLATSWDRESDR